MFKRKIISVGVMLTLITQIVLEPFIAYGDQLPFTKKTIINEMPQSILYEPFKASIKKLLEQANGEKEAAIPIQSNGTEEVQDLTYLLPLSTDNKIKQSENLSIKPGKQKIEIRNDKKEVIVKFKDINKREKSKKKLSEKNQNYHLNQSIGQKISNWKP